jgi:hypothetical protein
VIPSGIEPAYTPCTKTNYDLTLYIHALKELVYNKTSHFIRSCDGIRGLLKVATEKEETYWKAFLISSENYDS